jgi:hypothetical protein
VSLDLTGITQPEGIVFDPFAGTFGTLVVIDRGTKDLYELEPGGGVLRKIDVSFPPGARPTGVTIAPGSSNPVLRNYYVTDRGVVREDDGRVFETSRSRPATPRPSSMRARRSRSRGRGRGELDGPSATTAIPTRRAP